jgi:acetate---CoA ligase (ADP-forming)
MSRSETVSVARLLSPASIAIVGISSEPHSFGLSALSSLVSFGYGGAIHLVSRNHTEVSGRPCVAAIDDLPIGTDLAVLCLPQAAVLDAIAACGRRRIGAAIVYASGFAETGDADAQRALAAAARANGIAMLGPNCLGLINHVDGIALCMGQPNPSRHASGAVAFLAQSGAMMLAAGDAAQAKGIGLSHVISTGNEATAGIEDFLAALIEDTATRVIALFIEQIRRPLLFLDLAARARERGKPLVMFHSGRTAPARRAAKTHTGALAGDYRTMAALTARQGVILVDSFDELIDVAALLCRYPDAPTAGIGVITNSGAYRGISFDVCAEAGLDLPVLSVPVAERLAGLLPPFAPIENPLDVGTQLLRAPQTLGTAAQAMLDDRNIGSVVLAIVLGAREHAVAKARAALPVLRKAAKPVAFAAIGGEAATAEFLAEFADGTVAFFRSPDQALRAMARLTWYGRALAAKESRRPARAAPSLAAPPCDMPRGDGPACAAPSLAAPPSARAEPAPPALPTRGTLVEYRAKSWLAACGIPVPAGALARDCAEALAVAARIGFPVALKAQARELAHKSDAGGVILGVADAGALAAAFDRLRAAVAAARPDVRLDGVLVERMAPPGIEMIVGARRDPDWGPVVAVGFGGILVEVLDDVRLMAPDVTEDDVRLELAKLRGVRLLDGVRGAPPADVAALASLVAKIAALMRAVPDLIEIDLNPVVVHAQGQGACVLDALVVARE